jgi:hypothetical protein
MDSGELLTTCASSGATLVAIIGGFLLTRYMAVSSDIQAADYVLRQAKVRLGAAGNRLETTRQRLAFEDLDNLFDADPFVQHLLARAQEYSTVSLAEARTLLPLNMFRDSDVSARLEFWNQEARLAQFSHIWSRVPSKSRYLTLRAFAEPLGVDINIYPLWSFLYEKHKNTKRAGDGYSLAPIDEIDVSPVDLGRRGRLEGHFHDAASHLDSMSAEAATAQTHRLSIPEPTGLRTEILILVLVATLTIVPSLLLLAPHPKDLSRGESSSVVALFLSGFLLLIAYLVAHADRARKTWRDGIEDVSNGSSAS